MFGWEFPPFKSGGLGTACYDLTKGLSKFDVNVTFVMPVNPKDSEADFVDLRGIDMCPVKSRLTAYAQPNEGCSDVVYGFNLFDEVERYAELGKNFAESVEHDVIHVHDWMTYKAGILAKKISGKPLVVHLHATEYDRTVNCPNPYIASIEKLGLENADVVVTNSFFSKENILKCYDIPSEKIEVVHWGIDQDNPAYSLDFVSELGKKNKIVLFLGRLTVQKGCDYFLKSAKKILQFENDVKFIVVGSGVMMHDLISQAHDLGIDENVIFTGALKGEDVHRAFQMADVFVMPSVSEPFGLVALESLMNKTPIILSKQSGASEVLRNCFKVDFWDVDKLSNYITSVLRYPALRHELSVNGFNEAFYHDIYKPAKSVLDIYNNCLGWNS